MAMRVSKDEVCKAVQESRSWSETLRKLGYCTTGNARLTLKKYVQLWGVSVEHFDQDAVRREALARVNNPTPLDEILVKGSTYNRGDLKRRLYQEGLKQPICELCGQTDRWQGKPMALIIDHMNGVRDDHRIENLRIVCPNCAATLETHCGRNIPRKRVCEGCGASFAPKRSKHRYCTHSCFVSARMLEPGPRPQTRKAERPPYDQLMREIEKTSYLAVGRQYGVSDNAIRKWVLWYEREREAKGERAAEFDQAA